MGVVPIVNENDTLAVSVSDSEKGELFSDDPPKFRHSD